MKKVKVVYVGPGADNDRREIEVSTDEAEELIAGGLWEKAQKKVEKPSVKKGDNDA